MQLKLQISDKLMRDSIHSERGDFFNTKSGYLTLSDGSVFNGTLPEWQNSNYSGEVVFNTGMTGYVESLTDPSYAGQILVFTYPLIGNYGLQRLSKESERIQVSGVVVSEAATHPSHSSSTSSLLEWLHSENVPILMDADTRSLTKYLRTRGTMAGTISRDPKTKTSALPSTKFVSISEPQTYNKTRKKQIILVDCGTKENIVRSLCSLPLRVNRVPYDYDYTNEDFDAVLLSNGPGDPADYTKTIETAKKAMDLGKPMFGICLGSQIMGLAAGAKTYKLKYGHRGHNQPCIDHNSDRAYITSQNHGYALDEKTLPNDWRITFRNLNDNSIEGIEHKSRPFFSVQFHPEACPGPTDTTWLFDKFYKLI